MSIEMEGEIRPYYDLYCELTGRRPDLDAVQFHFRRFVKRGYSLRDLKILTRWVLKLERSGRVTEAALQAGKLLAPEMATERLEDAKRVIAKARREKAARERLARLSAPSEHEEITAADRDLIAREVQSFRRSLAPGARRQNRDPGA